MIFTSMKLYGQNSMILMIVPVLLVHVSATINQSAHVLLYKHITSTASLEVSKRQVSLQTWMGFKNLSCTRLSPSILGSKPCPDTLTPTRLTMDLNSAGMYPSQSSLGQRMPSGIYREHHFTKQMSNTTLTQNSSLVLWWVHSSSPSYHSRCIAVQSTPLKRSAQTSAELLWIVRNWISVLIHLLMPIYTDARTGNYLSRLHRQLLGSSSKLGNNTPATRYSSLNWISKDGTVGSCSTLYPLSSSLLGGAERSFSTCASVSETAQQHLRRKESFGQSSNSSILRYLLFQALLIPESPVLVKHTVNAVKTSLAAILMIFWALRRSSWLKSSSKTPFFLLNHSVFTFRKPLVTFHLLIRSLIH